MTEATITIKLCVKFEGDAATQDEVRTWLWRHENEALSAIERSLRFEPQHLNPMYLDDNRQVYPVDLVWTDPVSLDKVTVTRSMPL